MNTIKCLIVDDEPPAITLLEKYASMIDQIEVVGTSYSAVKAFDIIKNTAIDLMFLDIQMPVLNGIDFIKTLKNPPAIILTTAYREYALEGYDLDIIDYLLKPIAFDRFLKAVDRYRERHKTPPVLISTTNEQPPTYMFCNIDRSKHKIVFADILYIESLKDYVRIHMKHQKLVIKGNIGSFLNLLPKGQFVRIHRSYIIALQYITAYNQQEMDICGNKIPIGVSYRSEIKSILKNFL